MPYCLADLSTRGNRRAGGVLGIAQHLAVWVRRT